MLKQWSRFNRNSRKICHSMRERFEKKEENFQNEVASGLWSVNEHKEGLKKCGEYLYKENTVLPTIAWKEKKTKQLVKLNPNFKRNCKL